MAVQMQDSYDILIFQSKFFQSRKILLRSTTFLCLHDAISYFCAS